MPKEEAAVRDKWTLLAFGVMFLVFVKNYINYQTGEFKMMEKGAHFSQNRGCRGRGSPAALAREESYPTLR